MKRDSRPAILRFTQRIACLLVSLSVAVSLSGAEQPAVKVQTEEDWARALERLRPGMNLEQVREVLGAPRRIARQILYQRYLEQWLYDTPLPLRLEFDCRRGQPPFLLPLPPSGAPVGRESPAPAKRGEP
jgi:hypothetical protein